MKKYAFLLLVPLLMAGGGGEGPEQKPIIVEVAAPAPVVIEENNTVQIVGIVVGAIVTIACAYLGATGQFTKEGRKERKNKKRLKKERGDFAKKESEK